jgi:GNAT superfamily N-acetyltransferase
MKERLMTTGGVSVARLRGASVGVLVTNSESCLNWIDQLYVAPGHTGAGIGGALLRHALDTLGRRLPIRLYTFQANTQARKFYERAGFKAIALSDGAKNEEQCPDCLYELEALSEVPSARC